MTRINAREIAVQILFGSDIISMPVRDYCDDFLVEERFSLLKDENPIYSEFPDSNSLEYINTVIDLFACHKDEIDGLISSNSKGWKLSRISGTALAVMRVAVCEMKYMDDIPVAVSINSAVEIDKAYDDEDVVSFVNGVLGTVSKSI